MSNSAAVSCIMLLAHPDFHRLRHVARCERGAIALVALLMAVFLVGLIYYVAGIGTAILFHERMQDAADAAALYAATMDAHAMNLIALTNMVMAALLATLVAIKLLETLTTAAITIVGVLAFFSPGVAALLVPLVELREDLGHAYDGLKPEINADMAMAYQAGEALKISIPTLATLSVIDTVNGYYSPPASFGFALPSRPDLPVADGKFDKLCKKAGAFVGNLITLPLTPIIGTSGPIQDAMSGAISSLTGADPGWFCGVAGSSPPVVKTKYWKHMPTLPSRQACIDADPKSRDGIKLCQIAENDERASEPDPHTGECSGACNPQLYELRAQLARQQCDPNADHELRDYIWQEQTVVRTYERKAHGAFVLTDTEARTPQLVTHPPAKNDFRLPCDGKIFSPSIAWDRGNGTRTETSPAADGGAPRETPICSAVLITSEEPERRVETRLEVTRVFHCDVHASYERKADDLARDPQFQKATTGPNQVPHDIEKDAALGDEGFQVRSFVLAAPPSHRAETLLRFASWGHAEGTSIWPVLRALSFIQVAQAEYYFHDTGSTPQSRDEWLWHMQWRARVRRFHLPETAAGSALEAACSKAKSGSDLCKGLVDKLRKLDQLVIH